MESESEESDLIKTPSPCSAYDLVKTKLSDRKQKWKRINQKHNACSHTLRLVKYVVSNNLVFT